jgi:uracil-DNA glycosylase family 4
MNNSLFDPECRRCPRLAGFLDEVKERHPDYHARPVPAFGDPRARLLVVGLAPGMHGANASGRPFTGDHAGILLYETLHAFGYGNRPVSESATDGLRLTDCRITNAVKCLPPGNKPALAEVKTCNAFLRTELAGLPADAVVLALGKIAHDAVVRALEQKPARYPFGHGACHRLPTDQWLLDSYHCSRYNTQTRRLTPEMFREVFAQAQALLSTP